MLRFFAPDENVGGGGGVELTTLPLLGKECEEPLGGGPGGGGDGRIAVGFCEALLSTDSFRGGNGGGGGADGAEVKRADLECNGGGGGGGRGAAMSFLLLVDGNEETK